MLLAVAGLAGATAACDDASFFGACAWSENGDCENNTTADWCGHTLGTFYSGKSCSEAGYGAGCTPPFCAGKE